ncbi:MAG: DUF971 domain-containing protein [Chthoniobacterales bacterium]|nr:DUF971 domain-containing protein [Chthoniobacterales bacterium]
MRDRGRSLVDFICPPRVIPRGDRIEAAAEPNGVTVRVEPNNLQLIGNELAIVWNDGSESYLPLELLRRACPCASCGGEPDVLGKVERPQVSYTPASYELAGWQLVGGYAVQPRWSDGHGTGIYSYQYLRRLAAAA